MKAFSFSVWIFFLILLACLTSGVHAQTQLPLSLPVTESGVQVVKLSEDSLSTSYYIVVHDEVKPHYHARHSEHIVVIEGEGLMRMNADTIALSPGIHVFIPSGTIHAVKVTSDGPLGVLSIQTPRFDPTDRISVVD